MGASSQSRSTSGSAESGTEIGRGPREMSQSLKRSSPLPASHSRALLATCGCSLRACPSHCSKEGDALRVGEPEKEVLGSLSTGRAPLSAE